MVEINQLVRNAEENQKLNSIMARLNEEQIEIKVSELLKDSETSNVIIDEELLEQLQVVIEQLVGEKRLVELTRKNKNESVTYRSNS